MQRLGLLYLHSSAAINGQSRLKPKRKVFKPLACVLVLALVAAGFLPVPISVLTPVEVTPDSPFIITAPFDGVVKEILPSQGQAVASGEPAVVFDDVHLLNGKQLAEQRMAVAEAKFLRNSQGALADSRIKRDIEVARAEYELAESESAYANQLYSKSRLTTPVGGLAIYSDKQDWEGKPVSAGEAILSIADPENVQLSIDLPVKDSLVLEEGADVKVFLDSDPLNPLKATLTSASYSAEPDKRDVLSYKLIAKLDESNDPVPRIGIQGTAQVFGQKAPLAYTILRRPYAAFRQLTGW